MECSKGRKVLYLCAVTEAESCNRSHFTLDDVNALCGTVMPNRLIHLVLNGYVNTLIYDNWR